MRQHTLASGLIAVVLTALIAGCAGPTVGSATVTPAAFDEQHVGTWNGEFWALGEFYYPIEGLMVLQIKEDRSFTVTVTPTGAANNIAKPGSWSGTVSQEHGRVVLHAAKGAFPVFSSLKRSRDGELYGVANDPASGGGDIGFKFEKGAEGMARGEAIVR
ncbi:MAG TPA: hypothetical protein VNQ72_09885 [Candidatus Dormibacteraeota bacterium]|nr:hypothetical protein [Candidatus Dormibacteraeota bacterium]